MVGLDSAPETFWICLPGAPELELELEDDEDFSSLPHAATARPRHSAVSTARTGWLRLTMSVHSSWMTGRRAGGHAAGPVRQASDPPGSRHAGTRRRGRQRRR